jgi:hypothetical protein
LSSFEGGAFLMTSEIADGYADVLDDFADFYYEVRAA